MHSVAFEGPPTSARLPSRPSGGTGRSQGDAAFAQWLDQPEPRPAAADSQPRRTQGESSEPARQTGLSSAEPARSRPRDDEKPTKESEAVEADGPSEVRADPQAPATPDGEIAAAVEAGSDGDPAGEIAGAGEEQAQNPEPQSDAGLAPDAAAAAVPAIAELADGEAAPATQNAKPTAAVAAAASGAPKANGGAPGGEAAPTGAPVAPVPKGGTTNGTDSSASQPGVPADAQQGQGEALPEAEAALEGEDQAQPRPRLAADDAPGRTEPPRNGRSLEPFAAVKAGADAVQNLSQMAGQGAPPVTTSPAQPIAQALPSAPVAPLASPPPAPVQMAGVGFEIATQALAGRNRFEIRLDPPELGRIDVRLDIDKDGRVTTRLTVERAETLDLMRRDAPQLERALQQAGLKTSDEPMQFSLRDQGGGAAGGHDAPSRASDSGSDDGPAEDIVRPARIIRAGGLDIRI